MYTLYTITKEEFISGWISGMLGLLIGHPIETIKVRQQIYNQTFYEAVKQTSKYAGLTGFYKGLALPLVSAGILNAVFFGVYGNVLKVIEQRHREPDSPKWVLNVFHAGCWGGMAQVMTANPIEVVKIRLQSNRGVRREGITGEEKADLRGMKLIYSRIRLLGTLIRDIYATEGVMGFYRGLLPTFFRDVPTFGIYMWTFVALDKLMTSYEVNHVLKISLAGGTAGVMSWIFVVPFDVVKSRLQTDDPHKPKYAGMADCFVKTWREGGVRMMMKGTTMIIARSFPVNAVIFLSYESCMAYFVGRKTGK